MKDRGGGHQEGTGGLEVSCMNTTVESRGELNIYPKFPPDI